jgi:hypothetical protein
MDTQRLHGDQRVTTHWAFDGMVLGSVVVEAGGTLVLHGVIGGNLDVLAGGSAVVHGVVGGIVTNHGGTVEVIGAAGAVVPFAGTTRIDPRAYIRQR